MTLSLGDRIFLDVANPNVQHILDLAKTLSAADRASVARDLLASLDYPGEDVTGDDADAAWRIEARRRLDGVLQGAEKSVDANDVHARIAEAIDKRK